MGASYDKLIDLASRTGDRLIVHNPVTDKNIVIMDVDEYEMLLSDTGVLEYDVVDEFDQGVEDMTSSQLLDRINSDIAEWRAHQEHDEQHARTQALEEHMVEHPLPDPFEEDYFHPPEWHTAAEVLGARYGQMEATPSDDFADAHDAEVPEYTPKQVDFDDFDDSQPEAPASVEATEEPSVTIEEIPFDEQRGLESPDPSPIPLVQTDETSSELEWQEEPLPDEEPVFLEEPV